VNGGTLTLLVVGGLLAVGVVAVVGSGRAGDAGLGMGPALGSEPLLMAAPITPTRPTATAPPALTLGTTSVGVAPPASDVPPARVLEEVPTRIGVRVFDPPRQEGPAMVVGPVATAPMMAAPIAPMPAMMPPPMTAAPMTAAPMMSAMSAPTMSAPMIPPPMPAAADAAMASWFAAHRAGAMGPDPATMRSLKVGAPLGAGPDPRASAAAVDMGPSPAPGLDPRPFAEAHWQGLEAVPKTPALAQMLKLPPDVAGVILDDVTLPADLQGFRAGDLVTAIDSVPTPNLVAFIRATERIRDQQRVAIDIVRSGAPQRIELVALLKRLGTANGETPPMIPPGAVRPHRYMGPCLNCHRIGVTGNLAADQGDNLKNAPGPVRLTDVSQHRDRGACAACHPILP
jgi:hypothetical protein